MKEERRIAEAQARDYKEQAEETIVRLREEIAELRGRRDEN